MICSAAEYAKRRDHEATELGDAAKKLRARAEVLEAKAETLRVEAAALWSADAAYRKAVEAASNVQSDHDAEGLRIAFGTAQAHARARTAAAALCGQLFEKPLMELLDDLQRLRASLGNPPEGPGKPTPPPPATSESPEQKRERIAYRKEMRTWVVREIARLSSASSSHT
jgi:hypothetical protein